MSKIIGIVVLIALTLLPLGRNLSSPAITTSNPLANEMEVAVLFSGLMVFHKKQSGDVYEVGILSRRYSPEHEFCVQRLGAQPFCREDLPDGGQWSISVTSPPGGPPIQAGHDNKRRPDKEAGQYDFDWILDLEKMHGGELTLVPGRLRPIITLPRVKLLTRYKSHDLRSWQGSKPQKTKREPFGFAAETVGFIVTLKQGENLVLRDDINNLEILKVAYVPPPVIGGHYEVITITNVRYPPKMESDFRMYYELFSGISDSEKFDFDRNDDPMTMQMPFNPLPDYSLPRSRTCCMLECTEVLLGTRTRDLE